MNLIEKQISILVLLNNAESYKEKQKHIKKIAKLSDKIYKHNYKLTKLKKKLHKAEVNEDYEKCVIIKNKIEAWERL